MNGPVKYGAIIYSSDIKALAQFYTELFSMKVIRETSEFISLAKDGFNVIVHTPPTIIPQQNVNTVKLFLTVDNLGAAKEKAVELGGKAFDGAWSNPLFSVCNIADSDGNHIQLREFKQDE
ncbi:VOC family protein [Kangiella sp.]|uniref:VOC family protein n=1 Tax=Kangiella sp. TaxID=1920245 RepID=UPI00198E4318|nr:VOC family protein [Kangiella sp.]MBD3654165.1 hypothetical protein [Kangiella sp.]